MKKLLYLLALLPFAAMSAEKIAEVEHSSTSVILNMELYDSTDPKVCPAADLTHGTQDLNITVFDDATSGGEVDFFECTGAACVTTDTIEDITTLNVFATPSANNVRFKVLKAGSCLYQFQFANAIFASTNANVLNIEISAPAIITSNYWVDLTPVSLTTLVAAIWDKNCISPTASSVWEQICTDIDAILVDTGTTNQASLNTIEANTNFEIIEAETADSGTNTTLVDTDALDSTDDRYNNGSRLVVNFASGAEGQCVRDYDQATNTITVHPAFTQAVNIETYKLVVDTSCRNFP